MRILSNKISLFIVLFFVSVILINSSYVNATLPPGEVGCGDGSCSPYYGEDGCTCPDDCPVGCTPKPANGGSISVKMDNPENELWQFYLGGGSGCGVYVTEEDGWLGNDDECSTSANNNIILDHGYGALSDTGAYCDCGDSRGDCCKKLLFS